MKFLKHLPRNIHHKPKIPLPQISSQENISPAEGVSNDSLSMDQPTNKDRQDGCCPQKQYLEQILAYVATLPKHQPFPTENYFHNQVDITEQMRITLLGWLIDVHLRYKLQPQTLFMAVNIIDQYLSIEVIMRTQLQLVGITALWIAAKYQETYQVPKVHNLGIQYSYEVFICDSTYPAVSILEMEGKILQHTEFNILQPTSFGYFQIINSVIQLSPKEYYFVRYLLELSLFDPNSRHYSPTLIAISSVYFAQKLFLSFDIHHLLLQKFGLTSLTPLMKECAKDLCLVWQKSQLIQFNSLNSKFSNKNYHSVSNIKMTSFLKENR